MPLAVTEVLDDEDLLELILLQGGVGVVLASGAVSKSFRDAAAAPSLWRSLNGEPAEPSAAADSGPSADARERFRRRWEGERWAAGACVPSSELLNLTPARDAGDARKLAVKINSASCSSRYVCLGGADSMVQCFDLQGRHVHTLEGHTSAVRVLESCEHGGGGETWVASAAADAKTGKILLWRMSNPRVPASLDNCGKMSFMFSLVSAAGLGTVSGPASLQFFRGSAQPAPPLLLCRGMGDASVVEWRPDGTPLTRALFAPMPKGPACQAAAASLDEPHAVYHAGHSTRHAASTRRVGRVDVREPHTPAAAASSSSSSSGAGASGEWALPAEADDETLWLRADSRFVVAGCKSAFHVWDVRRGGRPLASVNVSGRDVAGRGGFEGSIPHRNLKWIDLASGGKLITTTYCYISGNQGLVALWDLASVASGGGGGGGGGGPSWEMPAWADATATATTSSMLPVNHLMRLPKPAQNRSLLMARLVGRQTILTLTPSSDVHMWRVGGDRL